MQMQYSTPSHQKERVLFKEVFALLRSQTCRIWWFYGVNLWSCASAVLTSISRVVDRFVRLDEDVSGVKGHHNYPLLCVEAPKVHRQIHILVMLFLPIQTIGGKLGSNETQEKCGHYERTSLVTALLLQFHSLNVSITIKWKQISWCYLFSYVLMFCYVLRFVLKGIDACLFGHFWSK